MPSKSVQSMQDALQPRRRTRPRPPTHQPTLGVAAGRVRELQRLHPEALQSAGHASKTHQKRPSRSPGSAAWRATHPSRAHGPPPALRPPCRAAQPHHAAPQSDKAHKTVTCTAHGPLSCRAASTRRASEQRHAARRCQLRHARHAAGKPRRGTPRSRLLSCRCAMRRCKGAPLQRWALRSVSSTASAPRAALRCQLCPAMAALATPGRRLRFICGARSTKTSVVQRGDGQCGQRKRDPAPQRSPGDGLWWGLMSGGGRDSRESRQRAHGPARVLFTARWASGPPESFSPSSKNPRGWGVWAT